MSFDQFSLLKIRRSIANLFFGYANPHDTGSLLYESKGYTQTATGPKNANKHLATKKASDSAWKVNSFKAELDGHKVWNASTDEESAYGQLSWPSSNVTAHITVGKDRGDMFVVLVFSDSPNLVGGRIQHGHTIYKLPISFGGEKNKLTIRQKWGSPNLYAKYPNWFIEKMKSANTVKIRMPWYQQAAMYFKFDVPGLDNAISKFK